MSYDIPADHHSSGPREKSPDAHLCDVIGNRRSTPAFATHPSGLEVASKPIHHAPTEYVDVVCDGFPNPDGPRFIELENESGHSIKYGQWIKRADGQHVLRIPLVKETANEQKP